MIAERVRCLTGWLLDELLALRHSNGRAMVRIYGPATTEHRGGTVTFNLYDPQGHLLDYRRIEELAGEEGISLRTGCFCNLAQERWPKDSPKKTCRPDSRWDSTSICSVSCD
jgi:molybdenum cofactor sulfurtransferase